ncbi:MAG: GntR family transcriptional regulator [Candidimonas sp.]|nr:MAG: GntR family transcriptional regulator [Candidimonas sp.]
MELDRARNAVPQLYEAVRTRIVLLELAPGATISRARLAAEFGISLTPVREALLKLADEKLVDIYPQAATRVSLIDIENATETHFLRRCLEIELVRDLALERPAALIAHMRKLLDEQKALRDANDYNHFIVIDQAFHRAMYEERGQESLWDLLHSRGGHIDRLRRLHLPAAGKLNRIIRDHTHILAAIRKGDPTAAQNSLRTHLSGTLESANQIRARYPQYFAAPRGAGAPLREPDAARAIPAASEWPTVVE